MIYLANTIWEQRRTNLPDLYHANINDYIHSIAHKLLNPETSVEPSLAITLVKEHYYLAKKCFWHLFLTIPIEDAEQLQSQIRRILKSEDIQNFFNSFANLDALCIPYAIGENGIAWLQQEIQHRDEHRWDNTATSVTNAQIMQNLGHLATSIEGQATSMHPNNHQDDDNDVENAPAFE